MPCSQISFLIPIIISTIMVDHYVALPKKETNQSIETSLPNLHARGLLEIQNETSLPSSLIPRPFSLSASSLQSPQPWARSPPTSSSFSLFSLPPSPRKVIPPSLPPSHNGSFLIIFISSPTHEPSTTHMHAGDIAAFEPHPTIQFVPAGTVEYHAIHGLTGGVGVDAGNPPFRQCAACKCCASNNCQVMQCCFRIKCNLPDKPFGTCAFVPEACNCNSCN